MGEYLKCVDPDNANKFVVISDGDIGFYEDVGDSPVLATAITQAGLYTITNGVALNPAERYTTKFGNPQVFLVPQRIKTFVHDGAAINQEININTPSLSVSASGVATISVSGGLRGANGNGGVIVVPKNYHRTNSDINTLMWSIPVGGVSTAIVYACVMNWGTKIIPTETNYDDESWLTGVDYSLQVGIGGAAGASCYGETVSGAKNDTGVRFISASVSGTAGTHVHVVATARGNNTLLSSALRGSLFRKELISLLGISCLPGGDLFGSNSYTALVVGR